MTMELPTTFADFAFTEARFRKQFKKVPAEMWNESMVPIADFLALEPAEREGKFPFLWMADSNGHLGRVAVSEPIVASCEERSQFWRLLREVARLDLEEQDSEAMANQMRLEMLERVAASLVRLTEEDAPLPVSN